MAKRKPKEGEVIKVLQLDQVDSVDWTKPEIYDFTATPEEVRKKLIGKFLGFMYERYRGQYWADTGKVISQNSFAEDLVKMNYQYFSLFKNGRRIPNVELADILAAYFGSIIWDLCGYSHRMPKDKDFVEIAEDLWPRMDKREKAEWLERGRNLVDNKGINVNGINDIRGIDTA